MNGKQLNLLAGLTAILVVVTLLSHNLSRGPSTDFIRGAALVQGWDPELIESVTVQKKDGAVTLTKSGAGFVIEEKYKYPAAFTQINKLIRACGDVRLRSEATADPAKHAELGVAEGGEDAIAVTFKDATGKTLVGLVKGKSPEAGKGGPYVRRISEDQVYVSEDYFSLSSEAMDFVEKEIFKNLEKKQIEKVTVQSKDGAYSILQKDDKIALQNIPAGKRAKGTDYESVFGALCGLSVSDLQPAGAAQLEWSHTYLCKLKIGLTYMVKLGKKDGKCYLAASASPVPDELMKQAAVKPGKDDKKELLEWRSTVIEAHQKRWDKTFNDAHVPWVYEISSWKYDNLVKALGDLVEAVPSADNPTEIAASHILIGYKGADRSKSTRSKEDAKKLAEKVLSEVDAPGADFAALAKKYSQGPSGPKGGDLGSFKKGAMHKNFEEAAWKLKVGETSKLVETPFGFHIIKRTK